jgi:protocatechuate 3,4-dioxygenase beta subunit
LHATLLGPEELPNPSDLWSAMGNDLRPAFHYRVIMPLDVAHRFVGPLVFTKEVRVQQGLEEGKGPFEEIWQVAGTVRDSKGRPIAGAEVRVKERGLSTQSDAEGRYSFPNLDPGSYTFVVTTPEQKAREQKVKVGPAEATTSGPRYDLTG